MSELGFIHRFVPANGSPRVLLVLHGTGGDEDDMIPIGRELDPAAALLSPRGKVLENGAARFFRRLAEGVFDEEDVARRALELAEFISAAAAQYNFDAKQLTAVGYSNGANIAAALLFLRPDVIPRAVLFRAMVPLSPPPVRASGNKVLISEGAYDSIVPPQEGERLAQLLRDAGADVTFEMQNTAHNLVPRDLSIARSWLAHVT